MIDNKLKYYVISVLRRASYRWAPRSAAKKNARLSRGIYKCNICKKETVAKEIKMDHIHPIVPVTGWDNWEGYFERLFCSEEGFQAICSGCHNDKTKGEQTLRKQSKHVKYKKRIKNTRRKRS